MPSPTPEPKPLDAERLAEIRKTLGRESRRAAETEIMGIFTRMHPAYEDVRDLLAHIATLTAELAERKQREVIDKATIKILAEDALMSLAGVVCTPEEGFANVPQCLRGCIMELRRRCEKAEADFAKSHSDLVALTSKRAALAPFSTETSDG